MKSVNLLTHAESLSHKSSIGQQHACVIATTQGKILASSINRPGQYGCNESYHAEFNAFRDLPPDLKGQDH